MGKLKLGLVILLSLLLCSCASTTEEITQGNTSTNNSDVATSSTATNNTSTYKKTLTNHLKVDAIVEVPKVKDIPTLEVTENGFDENNLINIFLGTKDVKKQKSSGETNYTSNNKTLKIINETGCFSLNTPFGDYAKSIVNTPNEVNNFKMDELNFMTKLKAIEEVKIIFNKLNITPHISPKIYSLDYNTLQKEQDNLMKNKDFKWFVDSGKIKLKDKWTKDDECYYIIFKINIHDIPCDPIGYTIKSSEIVIPGSEVRAIVSKNGIESFEIIGSIYNEKSAKKSTSPIINIDQAVDALKEKFSKIILTSEVKVTDISIVYVPIIVNCKTDPKTGSLLNKQLEMVPAWHFNLEENFSKNGKNETISFVVRINAITGKEIF